MTVRGPADATDAFGALVTCAGDVDGDGHVDMLVGDSQGGLSSAIHGVTHLYRGGAWWALDDRLAESPRPWRGDDLDVGRRRRER